MRLARTSLLVLVALALALPGHARAAGLLDPLLRFRQMRTPHFTIYFHQGEERLAARLASMAEEIRLQVGGVLGTTPPAHTHVILADQGEAANGWATPLPRNTIFLNAAAPSGADFIGRTSNWLRLVLTHEYTHIVHLDRSRGLPRMVRGVLGRSVAAFPNLWLPQWQVEGLATFEESAITGEGRLHAGDFRAIERVAALQGRQLGLDRASGGLVRWPGGHAAYASGLGFHAYLAERFGPQSLGMLATATSGRLPLFGTRAFRGVYGQSLGALWREYTAGVSAAALPAVAPGPTQVTQRGYLQAGPRFVREACAACPDEIVYSSQSPDAFPSLRAVRADGAHDRPLTTRYLGSTTGVAGSLLVFDQHELRRDVAMLSDLYAFDRQTGVVSALSREARLQDPDVSIDGRGVAAVREARGRRELVVGELTRASGQVGLANVRVLLSEPDTQFGAPRWSPDGRWLAVERRRLGALPDVVVIDAATGVSRRAIADVAARVVTPAWRPDGRAIVAAADFDEGPFDLYEFVLDEPTGARRLTRTHGALWPDVSADGRTLAFAGYTALGYDIFTVSYAPAGDETPRPLRAPGVSASPDSVEPSLADQASGYSPLPTLLPTSWTPLLLAGSEQVRVGGVVGGADVLARHAYALSLSWLASGPAVWRPVAPELPDWSAAYAYTRWTPSFFASASRETLFRAVREGAAAPLTTAVVQQQQQVGVFLPLVHVRTNAQALASIVRTESRYRLAGGDRTSTIVSSRLALARDTTQRHGYSISRETGLNAGGTIELARRALGSSSDATTATADVRAYLPGFGVHQVLALRVAAASSTGAEQARQVFRLGAVGASPSVIDFGNSTLGLFRGSTGATQTGSRLLVANAEYRFPVAVVERGYGTLPLLWRTLHGAVFVDAGKLDRDEAGDRRWRRAAGAELSSDVVIGYGLPLAATVGVAWSHDGQGFRGATVYARFGRAF